MPRLTRHDFERLLEFRVTWRRFQRWSEDQAQAEGLTHVQHPVSLGAPGPGAIARARGAYGPCSVRTANSRSPGAVGEVRR